MDPYRIRLATIFPGCRLGSSAGVTAEILSSMKRFHFYPGAKHLFFEENRPDDYKSDAARQRLESDAGTSESETLGKMWGGTYARAGTRPLLFAVTVG